MIGEESVGTKTRSKMLKHRCKEIYFWSQSVNYTLAEYFKNLKDPAFVLGVKAFSKADFVLIKSSRNSISFDREMNEDSKAVLALVTELFQLF